MYTSKDHTFVVCAYKENANLETSIRSILNQTVKSAIIIATSTPNSHINDISRKYNIPLYINQGRPSIAGDWNFGYSRAKTDLVTLVHQDDYYNSDYLEKILLSINKRKDTIIIFTNYYEIRENKICNNNLLLIIKRIMNLTFRYSITQKSKIMRKFVLALGNPINCPSVTYNRDRIGKNPFDTKYKNSCDYMAWVRLSGISGRYLYIPQKLMGHRIYEGSETTKNICENVRKEEDLEIRCKMMPRYLAKKINNIYVLSEKSNILHHDHR